MIQCGSRSNSDAAVLTQAVCDAHKTCCDLVFNPVREHVVDRLKSQYPMFNEEQFDRLLACDLYEDAGAVLITGGTSGTSGTGGSAVTPSGGPGKCVISDEAVSYRIRAVPNSLMAWKTATCTDNPFGWNSVEKLVEYANVRIKRTGPDVVIFIKKDIYEIVKKFNLMYKLYYTQDFAMISWYMHNNKQ